MVKTIKMEVYKFKCLAYEPPAAWLTAVTQMPEFENLRKDPRFVEFKKRQKFPED